MVGLIFGQWEDFFTPLASEVTAVWLSWFPEPE
jgi:hypothetical protein